MTQK
jgi:hypothetical protein